jgi:signal peptidase I
MQTSTTGAAQAAPEQPVFSSSPSATPRRHRLFKWLLLSLGLLLLIVLIAAVIFYRFVAVQVFIIPSEAMEPTLMGHDAGLNPATGQAHTDTIHDRILVNKLIYGSRLPARGDIIVFRAPARADRADTQNNRPAQEMILVKRVIGVPGDTIEVKEGAVYRNGQKLDEPYIKEPMMKFETGLSEYGVGQPLTIAPGQLYVLGDNRNDSNDSRYWGTLDRDRVIGKATAIIWPPERQRPLDK